MAVLIDETKPVPGAPPKADEPTDDSHDSLKNNPERLKTVKRISRLIDTRMQAHDETAIKAHSELVCRLPAKGYGTTEFDMSDKRMEALITAGYDAMTKYLDGLRSAPGDA